MADLAVGDLLTADQLAGLPDEAEVVDQHAGCRYHADGEGRLAYRPTGLVVGDLADLHASDGPFRLVALPTVQEVRQ